MRGLFHFSIKEYPMILLVCGGRNFTDAEYAIPRFHRVHLETPVTRLVCGMADGGDKLAYEWAKIHNIPVDEYRPDWKQFGRTAGPLRNEDMLREGKPDTVLGLPGGNGTAHMLSIARTAGVRVIEYQRRNFSRASDPELGWCSNFLEHEQIDPVTGIHYRSNEHYYQAEKTLDAESRQWIIESPDPATAKYRGNHKELVLRPDWDTYKLEAMWKGLQMKFPDGSELNEKLILTGDLYLVEYAPWGDTFWGVNRNYIGQNWLGRLLMRRRDQSDPNHL
jgi:ribA/ribD-fused uncharacterized protein